MFKGGTSLSKAHRLIRRFSEDIDLSARCHDLTGNRTKHLLSRAEKAITVDLKSQRDPMRESKGTQFRKSVYAYPGVINKGDMRFASEAPIFADASGVWPTLKPGYREELRQIVYDQDLPEDQEVLNTLGHLHHHV